MIQNGEEICRLCLRTEDSMPYIEDERKNSLIEKVYKISSIKITFDDGLPNAVCFLCTKKIEDFFDFRAQIIETETILRKCLTVKMSNKYSANDEMQLVCVEEDGTQVFTLDDEFDNGDDSVVVVPINKDKNNRLLVNNDSNHENSVVLYPKKQNTTNKSLPLKIISVVDYIQSSNGNGLEKGSQNAENIDLNNAINEINKLDEINLELNKRPDHSNNIKIRKKQHENGLEIDKIEFGSTKLRKALKENKCVVSCQLCLKQFLQYDQLQLHISDHFEGFHNYETLIDDFSDCEIEDGTETKKLNKSIVCKYCLVCFENLDEHITREHSDGKFVCKHCSQTFKNENLFKGHLKLTHYILQCNLCPIKFQSYLQLQSHLSSVHYKGSLWCPPCSKAFTQKYDFILHQRRHLGIRPFQCKYCVKKFVTVTLCKEHERRHTKETTFLCKYCGKSYVRISDLRNHEKTVHASEGPVNCKICFKLFSNMSSYKLHSKRHELGLRFVCKVCGKAYYSNSELQRHEQVHSGTRKYPCELCENSFMSQPELNRHLKYHKGEKKYKCSECGKCYYESGHLRIHERSHTGIKPFECRICSKRFVSRPKLIRHSKTHDQNKIQKNFELNKVTVQQSHTNGQDTNWNENYTGNLQPSSKRIEFLNDQIVIIDENQSEVQTKSIDIVQDEMEDNFNKNIVEIQDYNKVINMDNLIVNDDASNVFEIQMPDGNIVLMENNENLINEHDLIYTSVQNNVKIEIIDS